MIGKLIEIIWLTMCFVADLIWFVFKWALIVMSIVILIWFTFGIIYAIGLL